MFPLCRSTRPLFPLCLQAARQGLVLRPGRAGPILISGASSRTQRWSSTEPTEPPKSKSPSGRRKRRAHSSPSSQRTSPTPASKLGDGADLSQLKLWRDTITGLKDLQIEGVLGSPPLKSDTEPGLVLPESQKKKLKEDWAVATDSKTLDDPFSPEKGVVAGSFKDRDHQIKVLAGALGVLKNLLNSGSAQLPSASEPSKKKKKKAGKATTPTTPSDKLPSDAVSEPARVPASKQARKPLNKPPKTHGSEQTSKSASKPADKLSKRQAREQASQEGGCPPTQSPDEFMSKPRGLAKNNEPRSSDSLELRKVPIDPVRTIPKPSDMVAEKLFDPIDSPNFPSIPGVGSKPNPPKTPLPARTQLPKLDPKLTTPAPEGLKEARLRVPEELRKYSIHSVRPNQLKLIPLDVPQPPVPRVEYGLDRVLFNPGVYHIQDPRSRTFNFDPYLSTIMPIKEFDFNALKRYVTSSKDKTLISMAASKKMKYTGSTSSMTSSLAHFHYLLSSWRPINPAHLSRDFPIESFNFTRILKAPSAAFLHYRDGTYAIDADKEFDTANILSMLGKSMEKLLTLPKDQYEKYRRENSDQLTEAERNDPESFHYTTLGDFLMRSQLDAYDPRLPGSGMFDLKTRAVVSIRMDARDFHKGLGYEIRNRFGKWESFEREYYDMIRAAFLKYSLQVRMGRMDGIFVAYHNTERIFGFQYIPLEEMDLALHGTSKRALGDAEFKISVHLLNKILDRATERFPKQTLRLHFETRPSEVPYMYVFAKPVTSKEVTHIQDASKAAIEKFEQEMMGLAPQEGSENAVDPDAESEEAAERDDVEMMSEDAAEDEEDDSRLSQAVWEEMMEKVEHAMDDDAHGIASVREAVEDALEESGLLQAVPPGQSSEYIDALLGAITSGDLNEAAEGIHEADAETNNVSSPETNAEEESDGAEPEVQAPSEVEAEAEAVPETAAEMDVEQQDQAVADELETRSVQDGDSVAARHSEEVADRLNGEESGTATEDTAGSEPSSVDIEPSELTESSQSQTEPTASGVQSEESVIEFAEIASESIGEEAESESESAHDEDSSTETAIEPPMEDTAGGQQLDIIYEDGTPLATQPSVSPSGEPEMWLRLPADPRRPVVDMLSIKELVLKLAAQAMSAPSDAESLDNTKEEAHEPAKRNHRIRKFERILAEMRSSSMEASSTSAAAAPGKEEEDSSAFATASSEESPEEWQKEHEKEVEREQKVEEEGKEGGEEEAEGEVMGMLITVRNIVNNQSVQRPEGLSRESNWQVQWSIEELPAQRTKTLYDHCLRRRANELSAEIKAAKAAKLAEGPRNKMAFTKMFAKTLRNYTLKGRTYREKYNAVMKNESIKTWGTDERRPYEEVFGPDDGPRSWEIIEKKIEEETRKAAKARAEARAKARAEVRAALMGADPEAFERKRAKLERRVAKKAKRRESRSKRAAAEKKSSDTTATAAAPKPNVAAASVLTPKAAGEGSRKTKRRREMRTLARLLKANGEKKGKTKKETTTTTTTTAAAEATASAPDGQQAKTVEGGGGDDETTKGHEVNVTKHPGTSRRGGMGRPDPSLTEKAMKELKEGPD